MAEHPPADENLGDQLDAREEGERVDVAYLPNGGGERCVETGEVTHVEPAAIGRWRDVAYIDVDTGDRTLRVMFGGCVWHWNPDVAVDVEGLTVGRSARVRPATDAGDGQVVSTDSGCTGDENSHASRVAAQLRMAEDGEEGDDE